MALERVLGKQGKKLKYVVKGVNLTVSTGERDDEPTVETLASETAAGERLIELTRTKLGQGWTPTTKPGDVAGYVQALADRMSMWHWIVALTDDEVAWVYAWAIKNGEDVSLEVLRRRPTRALLAWMLSRWDEYYQDDWTKAVKFLSKDPERAAWINEELVAALEKGTLPSDRAKKFAERNSKKIAAGPKPAPVVPSSPTGSEAGLLEMIAQAPQDDAPRLVYADWLLEHGFGFGEYIQVSCEIAPVDYNDARYDGLRAKLEKLEKKHAKAWLEPIRPFIRSWSFERGLLSRVTCDAALFIEAAEAIAQRGPRAYIELTGLKKKDIAALAKTPLGAFGHVNLSSQRIDDHGMALIAASSTIAGAPSWDLGYNAFGDDGLVSLATSPHFASVETLRMSAFKLQFTARGIGALLASPHLGKLRELAVSVDSPRDAFAECTLSLESLSLVVGAFTNAHAEALASAPSLAKLTYLAIQQSGNTPLELDDDGVKHLLAKMPQLRQFSSSITLSKATLALIESRANT